MYRFSTFYYSSETAQILKIENPPCCRLERMVSENILLRTVFNLPWQWTRVKKCARSKPVLCRSSFRNIIMKAGMDWLADFRNCTIPKTSTNNKTSKAFGLHQNSAEISAFWKCNLPAIFLLNWKDRMLCGALFVSELFWLILKYDLCNKLFSNISNLKFWKIVGKMLW